jgi:signal transduction histidine kinase
MWLRIKLTAVFAGLIALPLTLVLGALWLGGGEVVRNDARRELTAAARSMVAAIEGRLSFHTAHLKSIAALPVMQDALIADDGGDIARAIAELQAQYREFSSLTVTDARGHVIATASGEERGRSLATEEGFRRAASGRVYQSALSAGVVSISVPVIATYDRQTVIATLAVAIDIAAIAKVAKAQSPLSARADIVVVTDRNGETAFASHTDAALLESIRSHARESASEGEIDWRDRSYFISTAASKSSDVAFVVHAMTPAAAALVAIDQLLMIAGTIAAIGAAAAIVLAWRWSTPLVRFGNAMSRLARGDAGPLPRVAPGHAFAPLGRAFEALRHMRSVHDWLTKRERELQGAKDEAERALRQKSEHLASLARALKEQLSTIVELSEAINAETLNAALSGERASYAKDISRSGTQLLAVINDLFDLSEAEAGQATLCEAEVDLAALVRESVEVMCEAAQKGHVALACDGADAPLVARIDAQRMKQVLFNLLSNAIKFTPEGGNVVAVVKIDASGRPAIIVQDTGIGMPASLAPMTALPFAEASQGRHGAGFGLPLVREIVDLHGGTVEIESESGKGTTVTVTLPANRLVDQDQDQDEARLIA